MLYSSGTTGYPKGVKKAAAGGAYGEGGDVSLMGALYGATEDSIYLSPAPLYHAAPLALHHGTAPRWRSGGGDGALRG